MKQALPQKTKLIWPSQSEFFFTSSTFLHYPYFKTSGQKQIVLNKINQIEKALSIAVIDFSIAINHVHIKFYLDQGIKMIKFRNYFHSGISREIKKKFNVSYKEFWGSNKIYFIDNESMSWKVTGYIIGNLIKHNEVSSFDQLENNPFTSYSRNVERYGREVAQDLIRQVIYVDENAKGIVDVKGLTQCKIK